MFTLRNVTRWAILMMAVAFVVVQATWSPVPSLAQGSAVPPNVEKVGNNEYLPAPGYDWLTSNVNDLRVKWAPGIRHRKIPALIAGNREGTWTTDPQATEADWIVPLPDLWRDKNGGVWRQFRNHHPNRSISVTVYKPLGNGNENKLSGIEPAQPNGGVTRIYVGNANDNPVVLQQLRWTARWSDGRP